MDLLHAILHDLPTYGWWWSAFVVVSFALPRCFGAIGVIVSHLALAALIFVLDVASVSAAMSAPDYRPGDAPDLDIVFAIGVLLRIFMANTALLPIAATGWFLWHRNKRAPMPGDVAPN